MHERPDKSHRLCFYIHRPGQLKPNSNRSLFHIHYTIFIRSLCSQSASQGIFTLYRRAICILLYTPEQAPRT